jgi:hypothetical protein
MPQAGVSSSEPVASVAERSLLAEVPAMPPRQASNWLVTAAEAKEDSAESRLQPAVMDKVQDRILPDEKVAPPPVTEAKIAEVITRADFGPFQFGLTVLAAMCLLACASLYLAGARRRSGQGPILDLNTKAPLRRPEAKIRPSSPRASAGLDTLEDAQAAIEARLRQFAQTWKRQAA